MTDNPPYQQPCDCPGHRMPGVHHVTACCSVPHMTQAQRQSAQDLDPVGRQQRIRAAIADLRRLDELQPPLIGIGGPYEGGKDTLADAFGEALQLEFHRSFPSKALNEALKRQNGWVRLQRDLQVSGSLVAEGGSFMRYRELEQLVGYTAAKTHRDFRELLQHTGTDMGRNYLDRDLWTKKLREEVAAWDGPGIITGIRYPNEAQVVRDRGGVLIWIERPVAPVHEKEHLPGLERVLERLEEASGRDHESEHALTARDFDIRVSNDGDEEDLEPVAAKIWSHLSSGKLADLQHGWLRARGAEEDSEVS